eukprot:c3900_g1_i1.p1 GENE.c3900_g1_i1~~c3900_g1_i1.p1  ORF type:complete len:299 (+),score=62.13 c3900_g1_i1:712-1608(+)
MSGASADVEMGGIPNPHEQIPSTHESTASESKSETTETKSVNKEKKKQTEDKKDDKDEDDGICVICLDQRIQVRLPCGHAVTCEACTKRLLELQTPCPSCRKPFQNYYRAKRSLIQSQPTYLNPEQSRNQFGSVVRLPTGEILRRLRSQIFARGAVCSQTCLILSFLLIVTFINVVPLGIGITELCIGILYNHSECDQPLSDWLIAIGCVQSASWATSVHSSWHRRNLHDHQRTGAEKFLRTTNSILLFVGANWVYRSRSCDSRLLHFSWYLVTITVCFAFTVFFMYCCIFVSSRRIS